MIARIGEAEIAEFILRVDVPGIDPEIAKGLIRYANLMRNSFIANRLSTTCSYRQLNATAAFAVTKSRDVAEQRKAAMEAIYAVLINRVPLKSDVPAAKEFGLQVYGSDWINK